MANAPVETKVKSATLGALLIALLLTGLQWLSDNPTVLLGLPSWLSSIIMLILTPVITFIAAYYAPHTDRPGEGEQP